MKNLLIIAVLILNGIIISAQTTDILPNEFGIKSCEHVKKLCGFGTRIANSEAEKNSINYIVNQFMNNDMDVMIDTFMFCSYTLKDRSVIINRQRVPIKTGLINFPLQDTVEIETYWIKSKEMPNKEKIKDRIVFTTTSQSVITLNKFKPAAIIVIAPSTFDTLRIKDLTKVKITLIGLLKSDLIKSYNVVATYKQRSSIDSCVIITAHWDSESGVGAGDNASGTAALIELSKFFKFRLSQLKYNMTFVATGAEESGLVGATSYILNNKQQIDKCVLNLNIDDISDRLPYIETTNVGQNVERVDTSQTMTIVYDRDNKKYLFTSFMEIYNNRHTNANSIQRLRYKFEKSMSKSDYVFQDAGCCSGVDSRAFNYIGIPYINISSINPNTPDNANSINDIYNDNFVENINNCGKVAAKILIDYNK